MAWHCRLLLWNQLFNQILHVTNGLQFKTSLAETNDTEFDSRSSLKRIKPAGSHIGSRLYVHKFA